MKISKHNLLILLFLILIFSSQPAHAYINSGSGSDFSQMITGSFFVIGQFFKTFFEKIKNALKIKAQRDEDYE